MPYYLYKVFPLRRLELVADFPAFAEASAAAKHLRQELGPAPGCRVKVVFAADAATAEALLTEVREPRPVTDADE